MKLTVLGATLALAALAAEPADACSLFVNRPVDGPAAPGDVTAPTVEVQGWSVSWYEESGTCGDRGMMRVEALGADTESPYGFVVEVVSGNLDPDMFSTAPQRVGLIGDNQLVYYFDYDLSTVEAVLHVRAVDLAGNRSEPVLLEISAARDTGCAAGGSGASLGPLLLAALALRARRRRP